MIKKYLIPLVLLVCFLLFSYGCFPADLSEAATRSPSSGRTPSSGKQSQSTTKEKVVDTVVFTDMNGHWAESSAAKLYALELVEGYPDKTYKPDQMLTKLETVVVILRSGGLTAEAEKLAAQLEKESKKNQPADQSSQRSNSRNSGRNTAASKTPAQPAPGQIDIEDRKTPLVPWGQAYIDLAIEKGFLRLTDPMLYDYAGPASRLEVAELLSRAMYLLPPDYHEGSNQANLKFNPAMATGEFSDLDGLDQTEQTIIAAVSNAGVMSGYPDGTFRPYDFLTRAEIAAVLDRLVNQNWVKVSSDRRLNGWISRLAINKDVYELTLTNLAGEQKFKVSPKVKCYRNDRPENFIQAKNYRCEVVLNAKKEVSWVQIIEPKSAGDRYNLRCSIKMVLLGEESFLLVSDMNVTDQRLPIAWDAVIAGGKNTKGFGSLKMGDIADVQMEDGEVKLVTILEVKKKSGTVDRIDGVRLYLKGSSNSHPSWFNYYDRGRMVNDKGVYVDNIRPGDKIEVIYTDPNPNEIDDEIVVEVRIKSK